MSSIICFLIAAIIPPLRRGAAAGLRDPAPGIIHAPRPPPLVFFDTVGFWAAGLLATGLLAADFLVAAGFLLTGVFSIETSYLGAGFLVDLLMAGGLSAVLLSPPAVAAAGACVGAGDVVTAAGGTFGAVFFTTAVGFFEEARAGMTSGITHAPRFTIFFLERIDRGIAVFRMRR